jgi:hypothetical protein
MKIRINNDACIARLSGKKKLKKQEFIGMRIVQEFSFIKVQYNAGHLAIPIRLSIK